VATTAIGGALTVLLFSWWLAGIAPPVMRLPSASAVLTDRFGHPLRTFLSQDEDECRPVRLAAVSPWMVLTTIVTEDRRFYRHHGVDVRAVVRAAAQDCRAGRAVSGASTLTMQLVRALHPRPRTIAGKLREMVEALALERRTGKAAILEAYLNTVNYSRQCRGIEAAAQGYFGIPARDLSLAEAAYLAAIPKSPARYDPVARPADVLARQRRLLARLGTLECVDQGTLGLARRERIVVRAQPRAFQAPQFSSAVRRLARSGAVIRTTLDGPLQEKLEAVLKTNLAALRDHEVTNGAIVALDNATGDVLAWVGSGDFGDTVHQGQVDGVLARRQPGSSLKPFLYGAAIERGLRASDLLLDEPIYLPGGHTPHNYDEQFHGPVRVREALACSFNIPAILVIRRYGTGAFLDTLHRFGFASLDRPAAYYGMGLALGSGEVTLLEEASAYAALGRLGRWRPPRLVAGPEDAVVPDQSVMRPGAAWIVLDILSDNAARAAAFGMNSPLHLPFPFAAKTGTTKDYRDNWASGCTPGWTVAVWVGNFNGKAMRKVSGITGAAPILHDAALVMEERYGSRPFRVPDDIVTEDVCPESGDVAEPECPGRLREVFLADHAPSVVCGVRHTQGESETASAAQSAALAVAFPRQGDIFRLDPATPVQAQAIRLEAAPAVSGATYRWEMDGEFLAASGSAETFWYPIAGWHSARVHVTHGADEEASARVRFLVAP